MAIDSLNASFYADPAAVSALKRDASTQTPESLRETAKQFESLFTTMLLKSMRAASPDDPYGSDQQDFYQDMFDQQLATQLSKGKGLGLADMLVRQLMQGAGVEGDAAAAAGSIGGSTTPKGIDLPRASAGDRGAAWPPRSKEEFVTAIRPAATAAARELGVDADTIIAHAALETGWGRSVPTGADGRPGFNLFGIKAGSGWRGAVNESRTHEFMDGAMREVSAGFRAYSSPEHSIRDYVRLLNDSPRYAKAVNTGSDVGAFARGLVEGGYATDPDYVAKLTAVAARLKFVGAPPITQTGKA